MVSEVHNPPRFEIDGDCGKSGEKWKLWKQRWESYAILSGLNEKDASLQVAAFIMSLSSTALRIYNALPLTEEERKDISRIIAAMNEHFERSVNVIYERYVFNRRDQRNDETMKDYILELRR